MRDFRDAKLMAGVISQALADRNTDLTDNEALDIVAVQFGFDGWNTLSARIEAAEETFDKRETGVGIKSPIPIFRIFDVAKAMEFYCGFLGFTLDWEHRFGENFPLYCQVSRDALILHLSEHAGDASPGAKAFVWVEDAVALQAELAAKNYRYMKPGLETVPWGLEVTVTDPFSNRIAFCQQHGENQPE